jgi:hypothetical protein
MEKQTVEKVEKQTYAIGDRVEKLCAICQEERGHVVASITKRGLISRVTCPFKWRQAHPQSFQIS